MKDETKNTFHGDDENVEVKWWHILLFGTMCFIIGVLSYNLFLELLGLWTA